MVEEPVFLTICQMLEDPAQPKQLWRLENWIKPM